MFGSKDNSGEESARLDREDRPHATTTDADVTSRMTGSAPTVAGSPPRHASGPEPVMVGAAAERGMTDDADATRAEHGREETRGADGVGTTALHRDDRNSVDDSAEHGAPTAALHRDRADDSAEHGAPTTAQHRDVKDDTAGHDARNADVPAAATSARANEGYERRGRAMRPAKTSAAATFALVFGLSALFCGLTGILAPFAVVFGIIGVLLAVAGRRMGLRPGVTGRGVATFGLVTGVLGLLLGAIVLAGLAVYVQQHGLDGLQQRIDDARNHLPTGSDVVGTVK